MVNMPSCVCYMYSQYLAWVDTRLEARLRMDAIYSSAVAEHCHQYIDQSRYGVIRLHLSMGESRGMYVQKIPGSA